MSGIKYAAAMLAAGAAVGAAASAQALTVVTLDLPPTTDPSATEYITLTSSGGSWDTTGAPGYQYSFGPKSIGSPNTSDATLFSTPTGLEGAPSPTPNWPTQGATFSSGEYPADIFGAIVPSSTYLQLEFTAGNTNYWGEATFATSGELETIAFTGVPEPETWALLLAGCGLVGGAMRGARRRRQEIAA